MSGINELHITCPARREAARPIRHAIAAFLAAAGNFDREASDDILTAVGEAIANAVEHAYAGAEESDVELFARVERNSMLAVDVIDRGTFVDRPPLPNRGLGLRIVEAIASDFVVKRDNGTHVHMRFPLPPRGVAS